MADIKALLKDARKLIDEKKYQDAQECCKNILRKDKQNYFALVLLGKSLQDSDHAPLAYQKAIASKPDHPLAWQGLANFYERKEKDSDKSVLFSIYSEMLNLQLGEEKALETISKLGQLGCALKNPESLNILVNYLNNSLESNLCKVAENTFLELLKADVPINVEDIPITLMYLNKMYCEDPSNILEILQCKVMIQNTDFASSAEDIINLKFFASNVLLREWFCKQLCIKFVETMSFCNFDVEKYINIIGEGIMNSKYPSLLKSMIFYEKGLYLEAYKECVPLVNYHEADVTEAAFIIKCTIMLKKWSITQKLALNFLTKVRDERFTIVLKRFLFISLTKEQRWNQAIATAKEIPLECLEIIELVSLAKCYIEVNESASHIMEHLKDSSYYKELQALLLLKKEKYDEVIELLEGLCDDNSLCIFYLGKAYWELKHYDKCLIYLLKAAKLNPDHDDTFLYLGHFYNNHKGDLFKAKKCYEKAYSLNLTSTCTAKNLSEIYIKLQERDKDFELLNTLIKNTATHEPWIYFRLGLYCLNKREWENAILNFRNVIKNNPNDTIAFECLADAYYLRGSFTSALRAYNKVMTVDPSKSAHCLTRIGYIYTLLTQYAEAIITFEKVFQIEPYSFLALKGIAETWMKIAKKKFTAKVYGSARDCAQQAIDYLSKALSKQKQFSCFWKLLADSLMFITKLPDKYAYVYIPQISKDNNNKVIKKEKLEIFPQAIACYSHIAKFNQKIASYDLASAYLAFYYKSEKSVNCNISFNLTISCIKEKPTIWRNWNLLGKICVIIKKFDIAQHCFIKALLITRKWSVARIWCNLGTLYLKLTLYKLANYCYWRGQSMLPSYPQSWIGQGLIAETIREDEAMDLFRHASRLGYHPESALGYADWVCRILKGNKYKDNSESKYVIEGLYAVPYAIDLVEWFCNYDSQNACAYNILGILQERYGLIQSSLRSYEKAYKYAEENKKNIVLLNIGRVLVRIGKYAEAIKTYKDITEASFNSTTGLALALYKQGIYEEAYSVYDTALHWLSNDDKEKANLLVAMAGIVYMYKGVDDAKTLLFHSIQISQKKPSAHSLFAICSLGLIHSDQSLSKLALSELRKYEKDGKYAYDIGFLKSYLFVSEGNMEQAIKLLSDCLHDHPSDALLWFCMAQYCLRVHSKAKVASCCAQKSLCLEHYGEYDCNAGIMLASASIAEHIAGNLKKALLLALDGLHRYPNQVEIWAALLFALLPQKVWINRKSWLLRVADHMRKYLNMPKPLSRWIILMEKKLTK